jgi:hypothetical protein
VIRKSGDANNSRVAQSRLIYDVTVTTVRAQATAGTLATLGKHAIAWTPAKEGTL